MTAKPAKTPLWQAIAGSLRGDISEGRYAPGDRLPTESELAERFGVNRHTVRHAIAHLVEEKLVRTRRGSGAYVTARPTEYPIGQRVRFHQNVLAAGRTPDKRILQIERRAATAGEARLLAEEPGAEICVYRGISLADGLPIALFESHFPVRRLPGLDLHLAESPGVTEALRRAGVPDYIRVSTRMTAQAATAVQALHLQLREGEPLLMTSGINVDPDGVPVEYGLTWFAGERVTLTLDTSDR